MSAEISSTDASDIIIKVENLTKTYKLYHSPLDRLKESLSPIRTQYHYGFSALQDVSFEIKKGETVGILGKNGSGKSTLLKLIAGVITPTAGKVTVEGKVSALLELGAGFNPELTGLENIYFNGTLMGYSREEVESRVDVILAFADIGDFVHQPVKLYSSGMFVRLAFAVAISIEPEVLIIDEALSVGDMFFQAKCMSSIDRFRKNGASILLVTHDTNAIKALCGRAVYLEQGRVRQIGSAAVVADRYMRDIREESRYSLGSDAYVKGDASLGKLQGQGGSSFSETLCFMANDTFAQRVATFRYGSGEARLVNAELLDSNGSNIVSTEFDEMITLRFSLICTSDCLFSVNYFIRDDKGVNITGSNFRLEGVDFIQGKAGDKYLVEYETKTPLLAGNYNVLVSIAEPVVLNQGAKFIDVIENAIVFKVLERSDAKIWSKVYLENKLHVIKYEEAIDDV